MTRGDLVEFKSVDTLEGALAALAELGSDSRVLAGGTDLVVQLQRGEISAGCLVHVQRVAGLAGVGNGTGLRIGALTTHHALANDPSVLAVLPSVAEAAATVGGWQTMATGTVGGNICNASPAADVVPPLLVHDAEVVLAGQADGERRMPLGAFLLGRRQTALRPDELLTQVVMPSPPPRSGDAYVKVGRRGAMEIAIVGLAARLAFDESGQVAQARVAVGSMGPVARRVDAAEAALVGTRLEPDAVAAAGQALLEEFDPIDDVRASAAYRRAVAPRALARAVETCRTRAQLENEGI